MIPKQNENFMLYAVHGDSSYAGLNMKVLAIEVAYPFYKFALARIRDF